MRFCKATTTASWSAPKPKNMILLDSEADNGRKETSQRDDIPKKKKSRWD